MRGTNEIATPPVDTGRRRAVHAADLRIEAWGPTREACISEAISALVGSFLGPALPPPSSTVCVEVAGSTDAELLQTVLRKVISWLGKRNQITAAADVEAVTTGLRLRCQMIDTGAVRPVASIPKGVSRQVRCERRPGGWWCAARIDV
jgi:SHS2 domain-containing protein